MKKIILAAAFTLVSLSSALASPLYDQMYHDNIRPNGHPRPQPVYDAALDACYTRPGWRAMQRTRKRSRIAWPATTIAGFIPDP
jgi:hypothetical protein